MYFDKNDAQANRLAHIVVTREKRCGGGRRDI